MTSREQALQQALETARRTRVRAEQTLEELRASLAECDSTLAAERRTDVVRKVKGKSSVEQAIEATKRMVEVLKRAEDELSQGHAPPSSALPPANVLAASISSVPITPRTPFRGGVLTEPKSAPSVWREPSFDDEPLPLAGVIGAFRADRPGLSISGDADAAAASAIGTEPGNGTNRLSSAAPSRRATVFFGAG